MTTATRPRRSTKRRAPASKHPHVDRANTYARNVVAGKIDACRWIKLACKRHLDDLATAKGKTSRWAFDAARAERACQLAELLPHVKGHWAIPQPGEAQSPRLHLEDWQCFYKASIYGWIERSTGLRRFRVVYLCVPRKSGKSVLAATDGLMLFAADGEYGSEVFSGATSEKQAWEVFRPAKQMAERTPDFLEAYGVEVNASRMFIPANGSRFEPVIGKPGDGASPSCAIVDEFHEHDEPVLYDTMATGMGARRQPLMLVITTAGENLAGPCYALQQDAQAMLERTKPNDRLFALIYTIDAEIDWTSERALRIANPNYDVSVSADFLRAQQAEAVASSHKQGIFKTKHLNIWVTARDAWMNMEWWKRQGDSTLSPENFRGLPCYVGLDLSSRLDLTALVRIFVREENGAKHYYLFTHSYCPRRTIEDPRNRHYQAWLADGHLIATEAHDGERIDLNQIISDIKEFAADGIDEVAYDDYSAGTVEAELGAANLVLVAIPQNVKHLSEPMKEIEALVKSGHFHHDGNPCFAWQMSNVTAREDANENIYPRKERPENKIDGPVAAIMAMSRALVHKAGAGEYVVDVL